MGDFLNSLSSGVSDLASNAGNALGSASGDLGTVLSDVGSALASPANAAPANTVTNNPASTPTIDPSVAAAVANNPPTPITSNQTGGGQSGQQQNQQPQSQQDQQFAPASEVASLRKALLAIAKQHQQNPWQPPAQPPAMRQAANLNVGNAPQQPVPPDMPIPALTPTGQPSGGPTGGETGLDALRTIVNPIPAQTGAEAPFDPDNPPVPPERPTDLVGDPAEARTPPAGQDVPSTTGGKPTPQTDDQGRQITVRKPGQAPSQPQTGDQPAQPLPTKTPLPTKKGGPVAAQPPQPAMPPQFMGGGGGGLPDLARIAMGLIPLIGMAAASGAFGGGGRRGRGGFNPFFHPGGRGHWPYFAPGRGWQMHGWHPGAPWRPLDPRHMSLLGFPNQGGQPDFNQVLQAILGGGPQRPQGQQRGGGYPPGMYRGGGDAGTGGDYQKSGNPFTDTLTGIESPDGNVVSQSDEDSQGRTLAQGGDPSEISQGYFQIQNYRRGGTWGRYAPMAGVTAASPREASYEEQHRVAKLIPIREWGHNTKARLHQKFGSFPESWTLGQLEDYFGKGAVAKTAAPQGKPNDDAMASAQ